MTLHRRLLDESVQRVLPRAEPLRGASVYVTGASGFLAASLLAFLSELDRAGQLGLALYASARRPKSAVRLFEFLGVSPAMSWTEAAVEDAVLPDVANLIVVHAASYGSPRDYLRDPRATYSANTHALVRLLEQRRALRQFVYFSSAEIYGQPPPEMIPTPETYVGGVSTTSPRSIYAESKRMGEVLAVTVAQQQGTPLTLLRPWNIYGPGQRVDDGRVPIEFIRQAKANGAITLSSNGRPQRALCHVWDGIAQVVAALGNTAPCVAFNIGNPTAEITMLDLARRCAAACGRPETAVTYNPDARAEGMLRCVPDVTAIQRLSGGAAPFTPLAAGLDTLAQWCDFLGRV